MKKKSAFFLSLFLCCLLTACNNTLPPDSDRTAAPSEAVASDKALPEKVDLSEELAEVLQASPADVEKYLEEHHEVIIEQEEKTLNGSRMELFYRHYLGDIADEIYVGRYDPSPTVYHLEYAGNGTGYRLTVLYEGISTACDLKEINRTENEYIFSTDKSVSRTALEVGRKGQKGLTIHNLCTHTWEHTINDALIQLVGEPEYEKWREDNASRTRCNLNIFVFLKDFKISYEDFMTAYGSELTEAAQLEEIIKQVYPQQGRQEAAQATKGTAPPPVGRDKEQAVKPPEALPSVTGENFLGDVEKEVIALINEERVSLGRGALKYSESLRSAARIRSRELHHNGYFAHTRPNGDSWETVLEKEIPFQYRAAGENLATVEFNDPRICPHTDANWWFNQWMNSPEHYELMTKADFTAVGVGIYFEEDESGMVSAYAAALFTQP